jgi:hypothetical protein
LSEQQQTDKRPRAAQEEEDLGAWGAGALAANPAEAVPVAAADSARLAVVDLDWERVAAVDLLALLSSFLGQARASLSAARLKRVVSEAGLSV